MKVSSHWLSEAANKLIDNGTTREAGRAFEPSGSHCPDLLAFISAREKCDGSWNQPMAAAVRRMGLPYSGRETV